MRIRELGSIILTSLLALLIVYSGFSHQTQLAHLRLMAPLL